MVVRVHPPASFDTKFMGVGAWMTAYIRSSLRKSKNLHLRQLIGMGRDTYTKIKLHNTTTQVET